MRTDVPYEVKSQLFNARLEENYYGSISIVLFNILKACPTGTCTILEPQDKEIGEVYVVQKRRSSGSEAPKP